MGFSSIHGRASIIAAAVAGDIPFSGAILRLIDANANRAAKRCVLEDYARFVLESEEICTEIKDLRHELSQSLQSWLDEAIVYRDTPGDIGTTIKTDSERTRPDLASVIIAAGKRCGEAMRAIEEFLKTTSPAVASKIEAIRYRLYEIEQRFVLTLRPDHRLETVSGFMF